MKRLSYFQAWGIPYFVSLVNVFQVWMALAEIPWPWPFNTNKLRRGAANSINIGQTCSMPVILFLHVTSSVHKCRRFSIKEPERHELLESRRWSKCSGKPEPRRKILRGSFPLGCGDGKLLLRIMTMIVLFVGFCHLFFWSPKGTLHSFMPFFNKTLRPLDFWLTGTFKLKPTSPPPGAACVGTSLPRVASSFAWLHAREFVAGGREPPSQVTLDR